MEQEADKAESSGAALGAPADHDATVDSAEFENQGTEAGPEKPTAPDALRDSWQFAAVVQFCRLFGQALKIKPFSADLLERALEQPSAHTVFLSDLVYKLLRPGVEPASEKDVEGWHDLLQRKLSCNWSLEFESNPLQGTDFNSVTPLVRVSNSEGWAGTGLAAVC